MEQILILLATLAGVTHGFFPAAETKCNAIHNASLCSATLGGSVYIQVMTNASGHRLQCKKLLTTGSSIKVFSLKKEKVKTEEAFKNRTDFFIYTGTLKIANVEKNDSGLYKVDVFDAEAVLLKSIYINLEVQENTWLTWIIVGSAAFVALIVVVVTICCVCRRKRRKRSDKKSGSGKEQTQHDKHLQEEFGL